MNTVLVCLALATVALVAVSANDELCNEKILKMQCDKEFEKKAAEKMSKLSEGCQKKITPEMQKEMKEKHVEMCKDISNVKESCKVSMEEFGKVKKVVGDDCISEMMKLFAELMKQ